MNDRELRGPYHRPHKEVSKEEVRTNDDPSQSLPSAHDFHPVNSTFNKQTTKRKIKDISNDFKTPKIRKRNDIDRIRVNSSRPSANDHTNKSTTTGLESWYANFMWCQLILDYMSELLKIPYNRDNSQKDFFELIKKQSFTDETQLMEINEIQSAYQPKKAIWLYTSDCGASRTVNQFLKDNNFDNMYQMRFFIHALCNELKEEHRNFVHNCQDPVLRVYHGGTMDENELDLFRQNIGKHIPINSFLSTTKNKDVAKAFAGTSDIDDKKSVLYQIDIDTRLQNTKEYAAIEHLSKYRMEEEVLIMFGSIFKIEQVEEDKEEQMWIVHLSMCSENEFELKDLRKQIKKETQSDVMSLGFTLYRQGKFVESKLYFEKLWNNQWSLLNDYDRANCLRGLGCAARGLKDFDAAVFYHHLELCFVKKLNNSLAVARTYYVIAQTYLYKKYYQLALRYSDQALILLTSGNHDDECVYVYHIQAMVYREIKQFDLALMYQQKTLDVQKRLLTENHPEFGITYHNMAEIFNYMRNDLQANDYYHKALSIFHKSCPRDHPNIKTVENKLSLSHYTTN